MNEARNLTIRLRFDAQPVIDAVETLLEALRAIQPEPDAEPDTKGSPERVPLDRDPHIELDASRLTWDGRVPTADEFAAWVESLPAGEFATGLLAIAQSLREREQR